jgi:uncharacterized protein (TIGR02246 family)
MNRRNAILTGITAAASVATLASASGAEEAPAENPELERIRAVLKAHDEAYNAHDLKGVLATLSPKAVIIGAGPGEVWSGHEEISEAYEQFFAGFDKGGQEFDYQYKFGGLSSDMAWMMVTGEIKGKKDGQAFSVGLNLSLVGSKVDGEWKIAAMHYSTVAGEKEDK